MGVGKILYARMYEPLYDPFNFSQPFSIFRNLDMVKYSPIVQGSGHGIHFRQKYIIYRNECLKLGKVRYGEIGGDVDDNWHPFGLQRATRNQPSCSKKGNSSDT